MLGEGQAHSCILSGELLRRWLEANVCIVVSDQIHGAVQARLASLQRSQTHAAYASLGSSFELHVLDVVAMVFD